MELGVVYNALNLSGLSWLMVGEKWGLKHSLSIKTDQNKTIWVVLIPLFSAECCNDFTIITRVRNFKKNSWKAMIVKMKVPNIFCSVRDHYDANSGTNDRICHGSAYVHPTAEITNFVSSWILIKPSMVNCAVIGELSPGIWRPFPPKRCFPLSVTNHYPGKEWPFT